VEDYISLLESGRKMEWSKSFSFVDAQNDVGRPRTTTNLSGNGRSVTRGIYDAALSRPLQKM
jgi:hypothetical protein